LDYSEDKAANPQEHFYLHTNLHGVDSDWETLA